jgi:hypothetical protein
MDTPDLYQNFGHLASACVPVQHPNHAAVGAQTVIYCIVEGVTKGDYLDISATLDLNVDPQLQPVVTGRCLWLAPAISVPNFNPTAQNPDLVGCMWTSEDINYIPAAGSGKYLLDTPRLRVRWPFDQTTNVDVILSVYAGSDVSAGYISVFPSQTGLQVSRVGPGWQKGVWRGMQADMTLADVEPGMFP